MKTARPSNPYLVADAVSRTSLSVVRVIIASYFLATATGLIFDPSTRTFLDPVLPHEIAILVSTIYLFVTAFAVMVGFAVRPAALLLAVYLFWSALTQFSHSEPVEALAMFWQNMALLGAVLLIALTVPGGNTRFDLFSRRITPRRINRKLLKAVAKRRARPSKEREQLCREAILNGVKFVHPNRKAQSHAALREEPDVENIFAETWREAEPELKVA